MVSGEPREKPGLARFRALNLDLPGEHSHVAARAAVAALVRGGLVERSRPSPPPKSKPAEQAHAQSVPPGAPDVK